MPFHAKFAPPSVAVHQYRMPLCGACATADAAHRASSDAAPSREVRPVRGCVLGRIATCPPAQSIRRQAVFNVTHAAVPYARVRHAPNPPFAAAAANERPPHMCECSGLSLHTLLTLKPPPLALWVPF
eukprot:10533-Chlamydomonas_euryale.AAC.1